MKYRKCEIYEFTSESVESHKFSMAPDVVLIRDISFFIVLCRHLGNQLFFEEVIKLSVIKEI